MGEAETADLVLRNARRAAAFAFMCVCIIGVMLLIDGQRNRVMLAQIQHARQILDEFRAVAGGRNHSEREPAGPADVAGTTPVGAVADRGAANGVVDPAPAGTADDPPVGAEQGAPMPRSTGVAGGPRGHE